MGISVLILTANEEINLPGCLESVKWCDDVVVFDSFSDDGTRAVAESYRVRFVQRAFDDFASQRNSALSEVEFIHPWVLMIDADERVTPELWNEIFASVRETESSIGLFRVRRKDMFMGRWLRHSSGYPTWFGRLIRVGRVRIERGVNEEYHTDDKVGYLREHLLHYPFDKGLAFWLDRHNRYSTMEATLLLKERRKRVSLRGLLSKDPVFRRKNLKDLAYRIPGRPLLIFLYLFFFRLGFLDGFAGMNFCILRGIYEFMIDLKVLESRRRSDGKSM